MLIRNEFKLFNCPIFKMDNNFQFDFIKSVGVNIAITYTLSPSRISPNLSFKIRLNPTQNLLLRKISEQVHEFTLRFFIPSSDLAARKDFYTPNPQIQFQETNFSENQSLRVEQLNSFNVNVITNLEFVLDISRASTSSTVRDLSTAEQRVTVQLPSFILWINSTLIGFIKSGSFLSESLNLTSLRKFTHLLRLYESSSIPEMLDKINQTKIHFPKEIVNPIANKYGYEFLFHDGLNSKSTAPKKTVRFQEEISVKEIENFKEEYRELGLNVSRSEIKMAREESLNSAESIDLDEIEFGFETVDYNQSSTPQAEPQGRAPNLKSPIGRWIIIPTPKPLTLRRRISDLPLMDCYPSHMISQIDFNLFKADLALALFGSYESECIN